MWAGRGGCHSWHWYCKHIVLFERPYPGYPHVSHIAFAQIHIFRPGPPQFGRRWGTATWCFANQQVVSRDSQKDAPSVARLVDQILSGSQWIPCWSSRNASIHNTTIIIQYIYTVLLLYYYVSLQRAKACKERAHLRKGHHVCHVVSQIWAARHCMTMIFLKRFRPVLQLYPSAIVTLLKVH